MPRNFILCAILLLCVHASQGRTLWSADDGRSRGRRSLSMSVDVILVKSLADSATDGPTFARAVNFYKSNGQDALAYALAAAMEQGHAKAIIQCMASLYGDGPSTPTPASKVDKFVEDIYIKAVGLLMMQGTPLAAEVVALAYQARVAALTQATSASFFEISSWKGGCTSIRLLGPQIFAFALSKGFAYEVAFALAHLQERFDVANCGYTALVDVFSVSNVVVINLGGSVEVTVRDRGNNLVPKPKEERREERRKPDDAEKKESELEREESAVPQSPARSEREESAVPQSPARSEGEDSDVEVAASQSPALQSPQGDDRLGQPSSSGGVAKRRPPRQANQQMDENLEEPGIQTPWPAPPPARIVDEAVPESMANSPLNMLERPQHAEAQTSTFDVVGQPTFGPVGQLTEETSSTDRSSAGMEKVNGSGDLQESTGMETHSETSESLKAKKKKPLQKSPAEPSPSAAAPASQGVDESGQSMSVRAPRQMETFANSGQPLESPNAVGTEHET